MSRTSPILITPKSTNIRRVIHYVARCRIIHCAWHGSQHHHVDRGEHFSFVNSIVRHRLLSRVSQHFRVVFSLARIFSISRVLSFISKGSTYFVQIWEYRVKTKISRIGIACCENERTPTTSAHHIWGKSTHLGPNTLPSNGIVLWPEAPLPVVDEYPFIRVGCISSKMDEKIRIGIYIYVYIHTKVARERNSSLRRCASVQRKIIAAERKRRKLKIN